MDNLTPENRRKAMKAVKSRQTSIERIFRSLLAGSNLSGWKCNPKGIVGNPDIVFPDYKIAIFIDGCFWHGCDYCNKPMPINNSEYWKNKIDRNKHRAIIVNQELSQDGWVVLRFWEHELKSEENRARISQVIKNELGNYTS